MMYDCRQDLEHALSDLNELDADNGRKLEDHAGWLVKYPDGAIVHSKRRSQERDGYGIVSKWVIFIGYRMRMKLATNVVDGELHGSLSGGQIHIPRS